MIILRYEIYNGYDNLVASCQTKEDVDRLMQAFDMPCYRVVKKEVILKSSTFLGAIAEILSNNGIKTLDMPQAIKISTELQLVASKFLDKEFEKGFQSGLEIGMDKSI